MARFPVRIRRLLALAALLAGMGLSSPARAQDVLAGDERALGQPTPMEVLVAHRTSLRLTAEQLGRLDRIRERLSRANGPLVSRMMALRDEWQEQRLAQRDSRRPDPVRLQRIRAAAEPLRAEIERNNRTAMQAVNRLLTPDQRARLRAIVEARLERDAGRHTGGDADAGGSN